MNIDIYTMPDLLAKLKDTDLNEAILKQINGVIGTSGNKKLVLKDMYEGNLTWSKDTITVFLKTCSSPHCLEDLGVEDACLENVVVVDRIFDTFNLLDAIKVADSLC